MCTRGEDHICKHELLTPAAFSPQCRNPLSDRAKEHPPQTKLRDVRMSLFFQQAPLQYLCSSGHEPVTMSVHDLSCFGGTIRTNYILKMSKLFYSAFIFKWHSLPAHAVVVFKLLIQKMMTLSFLICILYFFHLPEQNIY